MLFQNREINLLQKFSCDKELISWTIILWTFLYLFLLIEGSRMISLVQKLPFHHWDCTFLSCKISLDMHLFTRRKVNYKGLKDTGKKKSSVSWFLGVVESPRWSTCSKENTVLMLILKRPRRFLEGSLNLFNWSFL